MRRVRDEYQERNAPDPSGQCFTIKRRHASEKHAVKNESGHMVAKGRVPKDDVVEHEERARERAPKADVEIRRSPPRKRPASNQSVSFGGIGADEVVEAEHRRRLGPATLEARDERVIVGEKADPKSHEREEASERDEPKARASIRKKASGPPQHGPM